MSWNAFSVSSAAERAEALEVGELAVDPGDRRRGDLDVKIGALPLDERAQS